MVTYRLYVAVEEAHRVDGFDGFQDLLAEPQGGAHGEGSSGLAPPQVGQVPPLPQEDTAPPPGVTIGYPLTTAPHPGDATPTSPLLHSPEAASRRS